MYCFSEHTEVKDCKNYKVIQFLLSTKTGVFENQFYD